MFGNGDLLLRTAAPNFTTPNFMQSSGVVPSPGTSFKRPPGRFRRRAPTLGEHTDEILAELGATLAVRSRSSARKVSSSRYESGSREFPPYYSHLTDSASISFEADGFHRGQSLIAIPPVRGVQAMLPVRTETAQPPRATWPQKTKCPRHRHVSGQRTGSRKGLQEGA
jgi:hypothetical protein